MDNFKGKLKQLMFRFNVIVAILFTGVVTFQTEPMNSIQKIYLGLMAFEYTILISQKNDEVQKEIDKDTN